MLFEKWRNVTHVCEDTFFYSWACVALNSLPVCDPLLKVCLPFSCTFSPFSCFTERKCVVFSQLSVVLVHKNYSHSSLLPSGPNQNDDPTMSRSPSSLGLGLHSSFYFFFRHTPRSLDCITPHMFRVLFSLYESTLL